jgi:hypothetical protein
MFMRKFITVICLFAFVALQYGKLVSYWHCRLMAPVNCDCQKTLTGHSDKDHPASPVMVAKEKAEEVFLAHEITVHPLPLISTNNCNKSLYQALIPADHTVSIFHPPGSKFSI